MNILMINHQTEEDTIQQNMLKINHQVAQADKDTLQQIMHKRNIRETYQTLKLNHKMIV